MRGRNVSSVENEIVGRMTGVMRGLALCAAILASVATQCLITMAADAPQLSIFTMNADGSELKQLVQAPGKKWHSSPAWSNNGKLVLFHAFPNDADAGDSHVFVVQADGAELKDLGQGCFASWSPDDKQIVFAVAEKNPDKENVGVWVMNADGKGRQFLFPGTSPVFSPDGSKILYASSHEGNQQSLYVYDMLEGTPKKILQEPYQKKPGSARWSPDGKKVAFIDERNGKFELIVIDANGSEKEKAVRHRGIIGGPIAWAPNPKIAMWSKDKEASEPEKLYLITSEGDDAPEVLPNQDVGTVNFSPNWSTDNQRLLFVSDRPKP